NLFIVHQRDHNRAALGLLHALYQDGISVKNAGLHHGVSLHFERVMFTSLEQAARNLKKGRLVTQGFDWRSCSNTSVKRKRNNLLVVGKRGGGSLMADVADPRGPAAADHTRLEGAPTFACGRRRLRQILSASSFVRQAQDLDSPRPVRQPPNEAALLQAGNEPVNAGLGLQPKRVLHLIERRRHPFILEMLVQELQQLVLLTGQHESSPLPARNGTKRKPVLFYGCSGARSRLRPAYAPFSECLSALPWDRRWPSRRLPFRILAAAPASRQEKGWRACKPWRSCSRSTAQR